MNNRDGQILTPSVAQELIIELFAGATVRKQEIVRAAGEAHTERGGQLPTAGANRPVTQALSRMRELELAENPERGVWVIKPARITTLAAGIVADRRGRVDGDPGVEKPDEDGGVRGDAAAGRVDDQSQASRSRRT